MSKARKLADLLDSAGDVAGGKIADDTVNSEHFVDGGIDDAHIGDVAATKLTGTIADARFPATLPAKSATNLTNIPAANITGTLPAIDGSSLTGITTDTTTIENNIAMLAFFRASDNSKAKYNLVDQVVDEYVDATGIDAGNSTNESLTSGYYNGGSTSTVTTAFSYTGSNQTWTAPAGVTSAVVKLWGAGGGGGSKAAGSIDGRGGGGGGYITATCTTVPTTVYSFLIGQSNDSVDIGGSSPYTNSYGGGGNGGGKNAQRIGGTGGGRSEFSIGGGANVPAGTRILVAGGGGGGTAIYNNTDGGQNSGNGGGGGGGGTTGGSGQGSNTPPTGGTQSAGGARGVDNMSGSGAAAVDGTTGLGGGGQGSAVAADTNYGAPGGGGGGYFGGGGGASANQSHMAHGGAGGSSFAHSTLCASVTNTQGSGGAGDQGGAVANAGDANYPGSSVGRGGDGVNTTSGAGANGGDGAGVIIYTALTAGIDLTLQSVASTAESAPTTGDIVILIEDASGTATINTDIKAYISRDGSAFSSQVTLTDEGDWGTNKRILAAHDVDLSGSTSGTSMKYKITTHNQSAGSKVTNVHATSLAWA